MILLRHDKLPHLSAGLLGAALVFCTLLVCAGKVPAAESASPQALSGSAGPETGVALWEKAIKAGKGDEPAAASLLFKTYFQNFRSSEQAEEALWQAARHAKLAALGGAAPEWEKARDLFRRYGIEFPKSPRAAEAYFELGNAHHRLRLYREALIYFKLFFKRYPDAPDLLREKVNLAKAEALMATGKKEEAQEIYRKIVDAGSDELKPKALMGLGEILASGQDPLVALKLFATIFEKYPDYHYREPELLRRLGLVYVRIGREDEARKALFHYLNLAEKAHDRGETFFALAESYLRDGDPHTALKLYERVLDDGRSGERVSIISRFRRAEYLDGQDRKAIKGPPVADLANPEGDKPFLRVVEAYPDDPVSQDARRALFMRYLARKDDNAATEIGLSYLRSYKEGRAADKKDGFVGRVLIYLAESFLARKDYGRLYQLYASEYRHVKGLDEGRFFYLVGQAFEALSLYEQASTLYFKAQGLSLNDEDKAALYARRAAVYLVQKDFSSAERVIRYALDIYRDSEYQAGFHHLAGKLNEAKGKKREALASYARATAALPVTSQIGTYVEARLRMLASLGLYRDALSFLTQVRQKQWLGPEVAQDWYRQFAEGLAGKDAKAAVEAGLAGVAADMPKDTRGAQQLNLLLGDLFRKSGETDRARGHLETAQAGPDALLKKKAAIFINQLEIDSRK